MSPNPAAKLWKPNLALEAQEPHHGTGSVSGKAPEGSRAAGSERVD